MTPDRRVRLGVLISGRGSNMEALAKAAQSPDYPAEVAVVIATKADAAGLGTASSMDIETLALPHRAHATRAAFEDALDSALRARNVDIVVLAGFMRVLTDAFVTRYAGRLFNIHPSLLPSFPGLHTHRKALEAGVRVHGAT